MQYNDLVYLLGPSAHYFDSRDFEGYLDRVDSAFPVPSASCGPFHSTMLIGSLAPLFLLIGSRESRFLSIVPRLDEILACYEWYHHHLFFDETYIHQQKHNFYNVLPVFRRVFPLSAAFCLMKW